MGEAPTGPGERQGREAIARGGGPTARAAAPPSRSPTPPFVWAATVLALVAGFGLGGALFAHRTGAWWPAAAQAHGHVQVFGWAGLLVLGVGLHFLPRLRGARLAAPALVPWVLLLYGGGASLRAVAQPLAAVAPAAAPLLPLSGLLELAGASLAVGMLIATARRGVPLGERAGLLPVLPYLALALLGLWASLALNAAGLAAAAVAGVALVAAPWQPLLVQLGLLGFLVPVALAVSVRTFPLYLRVRVPSARGLRVVFVALAAGLALRLAAETGAPAVADALGRLLVGAALLGAARLVDAPFVRTRAAVLADTDTRARQYGVAPRPPPSLTSDLLAAEALLRSAYGWLVVAAGLLLAGGLAALAGAPGPALDAERHALGAGFITLLILGMGARLLPGFVGREHLASARLVWATLWLGNAAALLRVLPVLVPWAIALSGGAAAPALLPLLSAANSLLALSGLLGTVAVGCFGLNLWRTLR